MLFIKEPEIYKYFWYWKFSIIKEFENIFQFIFEGTTFNEWLIWYFVLFLLFGQSYFDWSTCNNCQLLRNRITQKTRVEELEIVMLADFQIKIK